MRSGHVSVTSIICSFVIELLGGCTMTTIGSSCEVYMKVFPLYFLGSKRSENSQPREGILNSLVMAKLLLWCLVLQIQSLDAEIENLTCALKEFKAL